MDKLKPYVEPPIQVEGRPYVIHKRGSSRNYWMRFSIKGFGQQRYALGTEDLGEAHEIAERKYQTAVIKAENEILEGRTSFDYLADQYVAGLFVQAEADPKKLSNARYAKRICERYLKPYFKRRTIASIGAPKVNSYIEWRKIFWTTGPGKDIKEITYVRGKDEPSRPVQRIVPSPNTLKRESNILRGVFKHAVGLGHIDMGQIPPIDVGPQSKGRRPHFTREQANVILNKAMERAHEVKDNKKLKYERTLLFQFIEIAINTGMRPIEIFQLDWDHLEGFENVRSSRPDEGKLVILGYGKGKLPSRSIPEDSVLSNFSNIWEMQRQHFGSDPSPDDPVFRSFTGKRIGSMKKSLNALLEAAGLKTNQFGEVFSAYSFRHSYATWQLQQSPPTDVHMLAINMRTSPDMIYKHYSHVIPDDHADQFRGRNRK
ncbi:MAG: tyrosine-type recombinase/integrase [Rhizobiaceae bacterium]